jgi:hypothetical protein
MQIQKKHLIVVVFFSVLFFGCSGQKGQEESAKKMDINHQTKLNITCNKFSCLEENKNTNVAIEGLLRRYTPNTKGKGAYQMFWDWELLLNDGATVPVVNEDDSIDMSIYDGKSILIYGNVFYGVVIGGGGSNLEVQEQGARGYRIDVITIQTNHNKK